MHSCCRVVGQFELGGTTYKTDGHDLIELLTTPDLNSFLSRWHFKFKFKNDKGALLEI